MWPSASYLTDSSWALTTAFIAIRTLRGAHWTAGTLGSRSKWTSPSRDSTVELNTSLYLLISCSLVKDLGCSCCTMSMSSGIVKCMTPRRSQVEPDKKGFWLVFAISNESLYLRPLTLHFASKMLVELSVSPEYSLSLVSLGCEWCVGCQPFIVLKVHYIACRTDIGITCCKNRKFHKSFLLPNYRYYHHLLQSIWVTPIWLWSWHRILYLYSL